MTLICGVLTDQYVALSSDRRVSVPALKWHKDTDVKTAVFLRSILVGWTGVAHPAGMWMEDWLDATIGPTVKPDEYFLVLQRALNALWTKDRRYRDIPHSFLCVGFSRDESNQFVPMCIRISNAWTSTDELGATVTSDRFIGRMLMLGNRRQVLLTGGFPPRLSDRRWAEREIRTSVRAAPHDPRRTLFVLAELTRRTADISNQLVGKSMMLSSLPIKAVEAGLPWRSGIDLDDAESVPISISPGEDDVSSINGSVYGPALIEPGMRFKHLEMRFGATEEIGPKPEPEY